MTERTGNKVPNNVTQKQNFPKEEFSGFYLPFEQFLAAVPDLYLILSPDLVIQTATTAFLKATHEKLQDLVGKHFLEVLTPNLPLSTSTAALRIQAALQETISTQKSQQVFGLECNVTFLPMLAKSGQLKIWNIRSTPILKEAALVEAIILKFEEVNLPATLDAATVELRSPPIASRNKVDLGNTAGLQEEYLILKEARENLLKIAEEVGQLGSYELNLETGIFTFSDGMFRLFGEEPQSFTPTLEFVNSRSNPEDANRVRSILNQAATDKKSYFYTRRIQRKDGEWRQIKSHGKVICDAAGKGICFMGLVQDVTEQNIAEKEFKESKKLLQSVFDTSLMAFSILEAVRQEDGSIQDFRIKMVNKALEKQTQRTDLVGRLYGEEYPGIKTAGLFDCLLQVMDTGETSQLEYYYPHEGFNHWFSCTFVKIDNGIFASNLDITTRKEAEFKLAEQTYLIQRITETVPDMISVMELKSQKTIYQNKEVFTLYGYEPEVLESLNAEEKSRLIHPEDQPVLAAYFEKFNTITDEEINTADYRAINFLKKWQWFHARGKVFQRDENGKITQILNVIQNITKRKKVEQELKESKAMLQEAYNAARQSKDQFEAAINVSPVVLSILKTVRNEQYEITDFYFKWVSKSGESLIGRDVTGQGLKENFPHLWQIQVFQQFVKTAESGKPTDYESYYQTDGLAMWVRWKAVQLTDGLFVSVEDITERKKGETELVKNLTLLRQSEELVGLGSWEYNPENQEFKWSDGMYQLFGMKPGAPVTLETYLDYVVTEDCFIAEKIIYLLRQKQAFFEETLRIRVAQKVQTIKVKGVAIKDEAGHTIKMLGLNLNITEIKNLEEENLTLRLQQQKDLLLAILEAQEEERRRISESLHNGVAQILYAAQLSLEQINPAQKPTDLTELENTLTKTETLIKDAIRETRQVSHELVPLLLEEFGLDAAIKNFSERFSHTGIHLSCIGLEQRLEKHLELAVYRISQELVNNIAKHSGASRGRVELFREGENLIIEVQDNGKGMNPNATYRKGIGLKTIRDRVNLLGGTMHIESDPNRGTLITIVFPLPNIK